MPTFTRVQKAKCVLWFAEFGHLKNVRDNFEAEFPDELAPVQEDIIQWFDNFKTTGAVDEAESLTEVHTTTYEKETGLLNIFGLKKIHRCHPYKMRLNAPLERGNFEERKAFAQLELDRIHLAHSLHLKSIWFCGEATFYTNGRVECHNVVYLAENPEDPESQDAHPKNGGSLTVWAALNYDGIIGPYMTIGSANKPTYRLFLQKYLYELKQIQRMRNKSLYGIFMHDDAPVHAEFTELLNDEFPHRWIGPGSAYGTWPRSSPDINPLCFFLWGHIKSKVYGKPISENDTQELGNRIYHAFTEITPEMMEHAVKAYKERLKMVVDSEGTLVDPHHDNENNLTAGDVEAINYMMYSF